MSGDVRSMFVGPENAAKLSQHEAVMRKHREQRANAINLLIGVAVFVLCILILVGGVAGSVALLRLAF